MIRLVHPNCLYWCRNNRFVCSLYVAAFFSIPKEFLSVAFIIYGHTIEGQLLGHFSINIEFRSRYVMFDSCLDITSPHRFIVLFSSDD